MEQQNDTSAGQPPAASTLSTVVPEGLAPGTLRFARTWERERNYTCPVISFNAPFGHAPVPEFAKATDFVARPITDDMPADTKLLGYIEPDGTLHLSVATHPGLLKVAAQLHRDVQLYGTEPHERARRLLRAFVNGGATLDAGLALVIMDDDLVMEALCDLRDEHEVFAKVLAFLDGPPDLALACTMFEAVENHRVRFMLMWLYTLCHAEKRVHLDKLFEERAAAARN